MKNDPPRQQPTAPKQKRAQQDAAPKIPDKTRRTFEMISDPKNAHLFTVDASLKAFAHVKI